MGIARTFQISRVFKRLSVLDNMRTALLPSKNQVFSLSHKSLEMLTEPAFVMLKDLKLEHAAHQQVDTLSLGDRKRLEFGMVLATKPKLLFLDEPTAGMGLKERSALMEVMTEHAKRDKITLLFVEHDIDIVFRFADFITVMARGKIFAEGTPAEIGVHKGVQDVYLGTEGAPHA